MPQFRLTEEELRALSAYLSTLQAKPIEPYHFDPRSWPPGRKSPTLPTRANAFRQMFCSTCHSLAVTRAGETKLIGGDIGPELTKVGQQSESRLAGCLAARSSGLFAAQQDAALSVVGRRSLQGHAVHHHEA